MIHSKNQDKGFTLVELLIVIVVLGILATVTVFAVGGISDSANENACAVELKQVITAASAVLAEDGDVTDDDQLTEYVDQDALDKFGGVSLSGDDIVVADGTGTGTTCTGTPTA